MTETLTNGYSSERRGELLVISSSTFLFQIFSKIQFSMKDVIKIVKLLLTTGSIKELTLMLLVANLVNTN